MNKIKFLNDAIETIFLLITLSLVLTIYNDESFTWFITFLSITLLFFLIGLFIFYKTIGKTKYNKDFTTHLKIRYSGNLNELINDFVTCDLFFHRQIGDCYTFSSKRRFWHNQMFFVEEIDNILNITCDQYSVNQLKQHPASFVFSGKVFEHESQNKNNKTEFTPIIFNKQNDVCG